MTFVPPPGYMPSYNPPLPYVAPVLGGLCPGMAIYVQGVVAPQPDWLRVNLASGPEEGADVALHLNPRFAQGVTVLNSRRGGHWGDEQRHELHPFCAGSPFEIVINVTPEGYRILVNGTFFGEFPHRLPPEQVTAVNVDGDLELHSASVLGGANAFPPCVPDMPQVTPSYPNCNLPMIEQPPTFHPPVPFVTTIPGGLVPKRTIIIKGFIPPDANRFHLNLRAGPGGDVLFHLNPRLNEGQVVRNAHLGGSWGHEERELRGGNPFQRGRYFDLSIRCGNHRFKVFAEGEPLLEFQHRAPCGAHLDLLEIEGDVVLSFVHF